MSKIFVLFVLSAAIALTGCNRSSAPNAGAPASGAAVQSGTVILKDGTTFSGNISKSDASGITLTSPDGQTRTYPMNQVDSVKYGTDLVAQGTSPEPVTQGPSAATVPKEAVASPSPAPSSPQPASPVAKGVVRVIPGGTRLSVRNNDRISADSASAGQTYSAVIAANVADSEGRIAIPKGSNATLVVRSAAGQGKMKGQSELTLDVESVEINGHTYMLETADIVEKGTQGLGANRRTAEFTGGGAALGTIIGAVAGGGKGAAIGAMVGGGAGAVTQTVTRGKAVRVPAETVLTFQLEAPVKIRLAR